MSDISQIKTPDNEIHNIVAHALKESVKTLEQTPYQFRQTPITANRTLEKLIGVSCAFNQLVENPTTEISVTANTQVTQTIQSGLTFIAGHKYLASYRQKDTLTSNTRNTLKYNDGEDHFQSSNANNNLASGYYHWIFSPSNTASSKTLQIWVHTPSNNVSYDNFNLIDLTACFGSEVADYLYTLERGTAGAGINLFKQLFPEDYYAYQTATLMSSKPVSKVIKDSDNNVIATYPLGSDEIRGLLKVENGQLVAYGDIHPSDGNGTEVFDIVDLGSLNWGFNADSGHQYFSTTDLNSIIKKPDTVGIIGNIKCPTYSTVAYSVVYANAMNNTIAVSDSGRVAIYDTSTLSMTEAQFKTAMSGVYLIYEKATPTAKSYTPFTNPMLCGSTEEFTDSRSVKMFCGHQSQYYTETEGDKLANLPEVTGEQGKFIIENKDGKQSLVTPNATDISYSNTSSGLTATKVQSAIDEVNTKVGTKANSSDVYTKSNTYNKTEVNSMLTLVKSATSGNPCTFTTDLTDNLISVKANIAYNASGYTGGNITRCGKNLCHFYTNGYFDGSGVIQSSDDGILYPIPLKNGQSITINRGSFNSAGLALFATNGTLLYRNGNLSNNPFTIAPSQDAYIYFWLNAGSGITVTQSVINEKQAQLELGTTSTAFEAYNGNTSTFDWTSEGTVYGGYLDVTNGKLVATAKKIVFDGSSDESWGHYNSNYDGFNIRIDDMTIDSANPSTQLLANIPVNTVRGQTGTGLMLKTYASTSDNKFFFLCGTGETTTEGIKTWLSTNNLSVVYNLETPIEFNLTPTAIQALSGVNNITSDLGGNLEVRYMTGEVASQVADIVKAELPDEHKYVLNKETIVGYWIDGRPIYEKTYSDTFASDSDMLAISVGYGVLAIIGVSGFLLSSDLNDSICITGGDAYFEGVTETGLLVKRTNIYTCGSTPTVYVTVRYIKS